MAKARPAGTSLAGNMMTSFVGNLYPLIISFASAPLLAHALGVSGRGAVAAAVAPLTLATTLATIGIPEAVIYTVAKHPHLLRQAARRAAVVLVLSGAASMAAIVLCSRWLSNGDGSIRELIIVASFATIPNLLVGVLRGLASALGKWRLVAGENIISSTLRFFSLIPFAVTGNLTPMVGTVLLAAMPVMGALSYLRLPQYVPPADATKSSEAARIGALTQYGTRIWIGSISGQLLSRVDQTLMTPLNSAYQLGLYVVAVNIAELPLIINKAVRDVTFATDAADDANSRLAESARISTFACLIAGGALAANTPWAIPFMFGSGFDDAVPVSLILLAAVVGGTPGAIAGAGLGARGRPGLRSISLIIACAVNLVLLVALVPSQGAVGAGIATLVGNLLASNLNIYFLWRCFRIDPRGFYGLRRTDLVTLKRIGGRFLRRRSTAAAEITTVP